MKLLLLWLCFTLDILFILGGKEMNKIKSLPSSSSQCVCNEIINVNRVLEELRRRGDKLGLRESRMVCGVALAG